MAVGFGKYQLVRKLGTGGMGEVFLARAGDAEKRVVVKRILPHLVENEEFLELFLAEARTAARLNHPNISQIFELGDVEGSWYLTMEYLAGHDLRSVVQTAKAKKRPLPVGAACRIVADAAAGLDYAHKARDAQGRPLGIVHRDVSPHNILVGFGGAVKLIDFGVAKAADRLLTTEPGQLRGKYPYMSPEQVEGSPVDHRADLFSLGVVFWELLTGRRLFKGDSDPVTLRLISECKVKPPGRVRPDLPPGASEVSMKALARNPAERFEDLAGFRAAVEELAQQAALAATTADLEQTMRGLYPHGDPGDEPSSPGKTDPLRTRTRRSGPGGSKSGVSGPTAAVEEPTVSVKVQTLLDRLGARRSSFPLQSTHFIGRAAELHALGAHLDAGARLVTLFGAAGTGKTRLACQYALTGAGRFGGVFFCDLRLARGEDEACLALARTLGISLGGGSREQALSLLDAALAGRGELLVVLDGFEALLPCAAATVGRWLAAPLSRFVVTSREPLRLDAEKRLELEPLEPAEAEQLFRERVASARRGFKPTAADEGAASELVKLSGRLPLALELLAAPVAQLTPSQLAPKLPRRFEGNTLEGVVEAAWALLAPWEQAALAQAAVFRGGFFLEAAEAVLDLSGIPGAPWVLDVLQALRDRSLLRAVEVPPSAELRFTFDESVRELALGKLEELPAKGEARRRHGEYYLREAAAWAAAGDGPALHRLSLERENLTLVFQRSIADLGGGRAAAMAALRAVLAIEPVASAAGPLGAFLPMLDQAIVRGDEMGVEPSAFAAALRARGEARQGCGKVELAVEDFAWARKLALERRDRKLEGRLAGCLAQALWELGRLEEALPHCEQALAVARGGGGDKRQEAIAAARVGSVAHARVRPGDALPHYRHALALFRELGDTRGVAQMLGTIGAALADGGALEEAERTIAEGEGTVQKLDDPALSAALSLCRGHLELALARADSEAARAATAALTERIDRAEPLAGRSDAVRAAVRCLRAVLETRSPRALRQAQGEGP